MPYPYASKVILYKDIPFSRATKTSFNRINHNTEFSAWIASKAVYTENNVQYVHEKKAYRLNQAADIEIGNCNYMSFINDSIVFYAFITSIEYLNPGVALVYFDIDSVTTFIHKITFNSCLIVREHVANDTNFPLVEEPIGAGEELAKDVTPYDEFAWGDVRYALCLILSEPYFEVAGASIGLASYNDTHPEYTYGNMVGNQPLGGYPCLCVTSSGARDIKAANNLIELLAKNNKLDAVIGVSIVPVYMIGTEFIIDTNRPFNQEPVKGGNCGYYISEVKKEWALFSKLYSLSDIYPNVQIQNKKCYAYPYTYFTLVDPQGNSITLKNELWEPRNLTTANITLKMYASLAPGGGLTYEPVNYSNGGIGISSLPMNDLYTPTLTKDQFDAWLSSKRYTLFANYLTLQNNSGMAFIHALVGAISKNPSSIMGGMDEINNVKNSAIMQLGNIVDKSTLAPSTFIPASAAGVASTKKQGPLLIQHYQTDFDIQRLDAFFNVYGYAVKRYGVPNLNTRPLWNYIELDDIHIVGDIPSEYYNDLIFRLKDGITFWNTADDVGNYFQDLQGTIWRENNV